MDIRDIAERSGYGVGTVSRVINGQPNVSERARERILEVMGACGYEPNANARYLKMRSQSPVAAFVMGVGNRLFGDVLREIQSGLAREGEDLSVTYLDDDATEVSEAVRYQQARHPKGMVFLGGETSAFRDGFAPIEVPCVLVTSSAEGLGFPNLSSVTIDNEGAAAEAVGHLWDCGHRRIGVLGGSLEPGKVAAARVAGAARALAERGSALDLERDYEPCDYSEEGGYGAVRRLLERAPDVTAVFALGDVIAFGAVRAIRDLGRSVPEDLSVVGFDGTALARYAVPRITTIRQDTVALGERTVALLLRGMRGEGGCAHELVGYELVRQESVRRL